MADKITVTSKNSYGNRVKNSFSRIGGGILLVILSIILLSRNENNFIKTKKSLQEGAEVVKEAVSTQIDSSLDQAEIHVQGETSSPAQSLKDAKFGIVSDDLKLARNVEVYQRQESSTKHCTDNIGGSETCETTYTYDKIRDGEMIDSSSFYESAGHDNPTHRDFTADERKKSPIQVGIYTLSDIFIGKLDNYKKLDLSDQDIIIPTGYHKSTTNTFSGNQETSDIDTNNNEYLYGDSSQNTNKNYGNFHIHTDYIYLGKSEQNPEIGDMKITFFTVKTGIISVIGQQNGDTITEYMTSNGRGIALLSEGNVSAESMFLSAQKSNKAMTRFLRFLGLFLMYCGFSMIFGFIDTIAKILPFVSNIIGIGTKLISFSLTLIIGFLTISIARLVVRPVIGIICLVVAIVGIILLIRAKKNKKKDSSKGNNKTPDPKKETIIDADEGEVIEA